MVEELGFPRIKWIPSTLGRTMINATLTELFGCNMKLINIM